MLSRGKAPVPGVDHSTHRVLVRSQPGRARSPTASRPSAMVSGHASSRFVMLRDRDRGVSTKPSHARAWKRRAPLEVIPWPHSSNGRQSDEESALGVALGGWRWRSSCSRSPPPRFSSSSTRAAAPAEAAGAATSFRRMVWRASGACHTAERAFVSSSRQRRRRGSGSPGNVRKGDERGESSSRRERRIGRNVQVRQLRLRAPGAIGQLAAAVPQMRRPVRPGGNVRRR
jgi:hypothetical protein